MRDARLERENCIDAATTSATCPQGATLRGALRKDQLELVKEAEGAGFDSVWAAEAYGSDAATVLAWLAAQTERIKIGSAIFQMPGRSPAMTAMTR